MAMLINKSFRVILAVFIFIIIAVYLLGARQLLQRQHWIPSDELRSSGELRTSDELRAYERVRAADEFEIIKNLAATDDDGIIKPCVGVVCDKNDNRTAQELYNKVRVLCYVPVADDTLRTKAVHAYRTWGRHCNRLLFFAEHGLNEADQKELAGMEVVGLDIPNTGNYDLTKKMFAIMRYMYEHLLNDYDWFMKADTDTYVVAENLRYLLSDHQPTEPIYFGHHFKANVKNGYMSGGGGYVLSREALTRFGEQNGTKCTGRSGTEDVEVGKCMQNIGVLPGDSRDKLGRSRFHALPPSNHIRGGYPDWYKAYDKYGAKHGMGNISDYAITFHYVTKDELYMLEFYIFHLRPYGILAGLEELNGGTGPVLPD